LRALPYHLHTSFFCAFTRSPFDHFPKPMRGWNYLAGSSFWAFVRRRFSARSLRSRSIPDRKDDFERWSKAMRSEVGKRMLLAFANLLTKGRGFFFFVCSYLCLPLLLLCQFLDVCKLSRLISLAPRVAPGLFSTQVLIPPSASKSS
jgi:hypothetical protein